MTDQPHLSEMEFNKKYAVELFNQTWALLQKPDRTEDDSEKMLQSAHASCYHWRQVGTALNQARGEWMISHVNIILGRKEASWHHAQQTLRLCQENGFGDFDLAFAYEAMARAAAMTGNTEALKKYLGLATDAGEKILAAEDKTLFQGDLEAGPWFGMR
jgi:hypothetical protein